MPQAGKMPVGVDRPRTRAAATRPASSVPSQALNASRSANVQGLGSPLPTSVIASIAPRFGFDFSNVRIHADARAARRAQALEARAYTVGRDVYFGEGQFRPQTAEGRRLLAHELAHVVQQRRSPIDARTVERPGSPAEQEAEAAAQRVCAGLVARPMRAVPTGIARDVGWARRGPIPDAYGMGYNTILQRAGAAALDAVNDLRALETASMDVSVPTFETLPLARRRAVLALEPHAAGTACESWFAKLRQSPAHRADALVTAMSDRTGELYWAGQSGADPGDNFRIKKTTTRPTDAAAPAVADKVAGKSTPIATETNTNDFAAWMLGGAVPGGNAKMNCWEAIMFAAFEAGLASEARLRKIHKDAAAAQGGYSAVIAQSLGLPTSVPLGALHPDRGDIVFFNGLDHVALSIGSRNGAGEHEVMSLWVLPPDPAKKVFVSAIQRTTIEELSRNMVKYIGSAPAVRFGRNPF